MSLVDIEHPIKTLGPEHVLQSAERLVSRPSWPEAVSTGQKVLLIDFFQHHCHGALRHLVFEGWHPRRYHPDNAACPLGTRAGTFPQRFYDLRHRNWLGANDRWPRDREGPARRAEGFGLSR